MNRSTLELLRALASRGEELHYDDMKRLLEQKLIAHNESTGDYDLTPVGKSLLDGKHGLTGKVEATPASVLDIQIGGDHYKKLGQYQPWQVAAACMTPAELRGYMKGTVLAYIMREGDKGGDLDVEKARHTIELWQEVRKDK